MKYEGFRFPNCERTEAENEYIKNDVLVLKEALEIMFNNGHDRLTIGACCLKEFQADYGGKSSYDYRTLFPDLKKLELVDKYQDANADAYIRHSYKGGWNCDFTFSLHILWCTFLFRAVKNILPFPENFFPPDFSPHGF